MPHDTALIATIAVGLGLAFVGGFVARWLKLPPLVGYLLAGVAVGPFTPGFVADGGLAGQLAEIGVILLMFGVGIHFSIKDLLAVRNIAVPGAIVQIAVATVMGAVVAHWWGWSLGAGLVFGLALSTASTVVLLRALEERGILDSVNGRIAVGWLIVEDLAMVLALVLLPALGNVLGTAEAQPSVAEEGGSLFLTLALTLGKVCLFVALMVVAGKRLVPWLLSQVAKTGSRELFTLSVLAVSLGIAFGAAALFGVSFALGAFFAGVVVSESELSHRVAEDSLPLQDAFAVLFFVSVGMLFDPMVLVQQPLQILAVVLIVILGKSLAAFFIVLAFRYPVNTALTVSASLAQIGEFSFILVGLGVALGLLPKDGQSLVLCGALLSITLNPLVFKTIDPMLAWLRRHPRFAARMEHPDEDELCDLPIGMGDVQLREHAVLIGYGRVGGVIGQSLTEQKIPFVVVEQNREYVERLREEGVPAIYGDAAVPGILEHAHLDKASILIVATPDALQAREIVAQAKGVNASLPAVVRTHGDEERAYLESLGVDRVVMGEHALARSMLDYVLERLAALKRVPVMQAPVNALVP